MIDRLRNSIDLNCDLGESFGPYRIGQDEAILDYVTSVNIACGYHAGDHNVMNQTIKMAAEKKLGLGAHPGLPDLLGFGRRWIQTDPEDVFNMVVYQLGALQAFASIHNSSLQHVKPHGALYNRAAENPGIAQAIAEAVAAVDKSLILFALAGSKLVSAGRAAGLTVAEEIFADRTYQRNGTLTPRTNPKAMIHSPEAAVAQVIQIIKKGTVKTIDGTEIPLQGDTVCVHGDGPQALQFVQQLRTQLQKEGIQIKRIGSSE